MGKTEFVVTFEGHQIKETVDGLGITQSFLRFPKLFFVRIYELLEASMKVLWRLSRMGLVRFRAFGISWIWQSIQFVGLLGCSLSSHVPGVLTLRISRSRKSTGSFRAHPRWRLRLGGKMGI
jgi:hypothetical protein